MVPFMVEVGQALIAKWSSVKPTEVVDAKEDIKRATLDIIGRFVLYIHGIVLCNS